MPVRHADNFAINGEPQLVVSRVERVVTVEKDVVIQFPAGSIPRRVRWWSGESGRGSRIASEAVESLYREAPGAGIPWHVESCTPRAWLHFIWEAWSPFFIERIARLDEHGWTMMTPFDDLAAEDGLIVVPARKTWPWSSAGQKVVSGARFHMRHVELV